MVVESSEVTCLLSFAVAGTDRPAITKATLYTTRTARRSATVKYWVTDYSNAVFLKGSIQEF
jgi:hypothetical protein